MVLLVWALVAGRLASLSITTALAVTVAGMALTAGSPPVIRLDLDTNIVERGVEVVLAILLFIDATEVPGGVLGQERRALMRLLTIALPLSLVMAWLAGFALFPEHDAWLLAVLAVIVVPVDLAPAVAIVRDRRVPPRLREIINVEAGLNDGVAAPLFLFCLAGATAQRGSPALDALTNALPAIAIAAGVGAPIGFIGASALGWSWRHGWSEPSALRLGVLALPLLAYALAIVLGGNGFVAAFVAGLLFAVRDRDLPPEALHLTEDIGSLLSLIVWFVFGRAVDQVIDSGVGVAVVVYALLALTVVRIVPVLLALRGTTIGLRDAAFLGWMGPRGLASLVFGLLAIIALNGNPRTLTAQVMVLTVLISVVVHGLSAGPIGAAYARSAQRASGTGPETNLSSSHVQSPAKS
jgi:NhaP-type Na+/H+ or K+/H+ antiporter